jgi:hypothetical protein
MNNILKKGGCAMRKILIAVFLGIIVTLLTSWLASEKLNHEKEAVKKEKTEETVSTVTNKNESKFEKYMGTWIGQDDSSYQISVAKTAGHENEDFYTLTISKQGKEAQVISLPIHSDGLGVVKSDKGVEYNVEFTKFYDNGSENLKPTIEISIYSDGSENASESNLFIRAFKQ